MPITTILGILSIALSSLFTQKLYNRLIVNYPNYASNIPNSFICIVAIVIDLILQSKFLYAQDLANFMNFNIFKQIMLIISFFSIIILSGCLSISAFIDIEFLELPDELTLIIGVALLPISIYLYSGASLLTAITLFVIFFILALATDKLGMGDVKLVLALGVGIKFMYLLDFMLIAFLGFSIYGIFKSIVSKEKLDKEMAFGPFLILAFLCLF